VSPLHSRDFGLDADAASRPEPWLAALRRRVGGRYPVDPFGLDPQLCDLLAPLFDATVRVRVEGAEQVAPGAASLVANRGLGVGEPAALAVAVRQALGRRLRVVGAPPVPLLGELSRRLGAVAATPEDLAAALRAGHLVAVPLAPTWLRTGAGAPPLALTQAMMGLPVHPVAIQPSGPLGAPTTWRVRIAPPIRLDGSYPVGDPLGAAELADAVRHAVAWMLAGASPDPDRETPGLAVPSA
jgi:hypothetical protein